ncbi:hypothetical protein FMM01_13665 [Schleiferilactobacillus harbinensis]|uniref:hypothetical protein n=1 Tax=Schleiferilactobacillus harbinensis TaxID=304207 RepID=UPI001239BE9B|nr:hypothetical protein [Schleiferilactobacillus harbinensis]QEU48268.1 hypothetical protein FMM01_13665 [Schleiferilactobacillus harbinensis]
MPIYYGGKKLQSLYFGGKKIASAWYGGKCVYRAGISPGTVLWSGQINSFPSTITLSDKLSNTLNGIKIYYSTNLSAYEMNWAFGSPDGYLVYPQPKGTYSPNYLIKKTALGNTIRVQACAGDGSSMFMFDQYLDFEDQKITIGGGEYFHGAITEIVAY